MTSDADREAPAHHPEHPLRLRGSLLVALAALSAFGPMSLDLYLPAFPSIADALGVGTADIQLTFSACLVGLGLGQLVYGPLSDRYGRRPPLLAGLVLYTVASLLCALSTSLGMLTMLRLLQGLGGCAGLVIARAIVRDCFEGPALVRSFSVISSVMMIAPLVAPSLGALALRFVDWRAVFVVIALFGVFCLVSAWRLPETHPSHHRTEHGVLDSLRGYLRLLRRRDFVLPAAVAALGSGMIFTYVSSSSIVFMGEYGFSASGFALLFAGMSLFYVSGIRLNMRLVAHYPVRRLLRTYVAVQAMALAVLVPLMAVHAPLWAVLGVLAVSKICLGATQPSATAEAMGPFARSAGAASALLGTLQMGFGALMAAVLATLAFPAGTEMAVAMLLLALTCSLVLALRR